MGCWVDPMSFLTTFLTDSIRIGLIGGHGYGHLDGILMASIRITLLGGHGYGHGLLSGYGHIDRIFNGFNKDWSPGWIWPS